MKLVNYLIIRITLVFTIIMILWSIVYLLLQMHEIHDGNDEGLINLKQEFVVQANTVEGFVESMEKFQPINLIITEIPFEEAVHIKEHFKTTTVYFPTEFDHEEVRMLTSAFRCELNGKYYKIQFFTSTVETEDILKNILYLTLGLWAVLIITLIVVGKVVISRSNKPFYQLLDEFKRFRLDNSKGIVIYETKIAEYKQLNEAVSELISKNINIFTEQKEFIENSSHELQTPIAVAITKLELMTEKYKNDKTLAQELVELTSTLNRMKRLNSSLLLLSKIKNSQFADIQNINMNAELQKSLEELSDFIDFKEITVIIDLQNIVEKKMNSDLARILFVNLLKNAITHNKQGGKIEITAVSNIITISNTGTHPIENLFVRYRKTTRSSGLGLSIVKSIADLYNIEIEYRFEENKHVFIMQFSC